MQRDSECPGDLREPEVRDEIRAECKILNSKEGLRVKKIADKYHAEMSKDEHATHPPVPWDGVERNRKTTIWVSHRDGDKMKYLNLQYAV